MHGVMLKFHERQYSYQEGGCAALPGCFVTGAENLAPLAPRQAGLTSGSHGCGELLLRSGTAERVQLDPPSTAATARRHL